MKIEQSRSSLLVVLALLLLLSNCLSSTAEVTVQLRPGAPSSNIAKVEVEVSAPGEDPEKTTLSGKTSPWTDSMYALAGGTNRTFTARALDSAGTQLYAGQATGVTLADGKKTLVFITLDDLSATSATQSEAPYLTSLTAHPAEASADGTVALRATVRDRNPNDTLRLEWSATGGAFGTPSGGGAITWTAPSTGADYSVDCKVVDSLGLSSGFTVPLTVRAPSTTSTSSSSCCKHCGSGSQPCGDRSISSSYTCKKPASCACYRGGPFQLLKRLETRRAMRVRVARCALRVA